MIEKVNPAHPDKIADRIAGALVDIAYTLSSDPRIAVEVLIGHGVCTIIAETSEHLPLYRVTEAVHRIAGDVEVRYKEVQQDERLADNQSQGIRCGDNGIFKGMPLTEEQKRLSKIAKQIYKKYGTDGKYILAGNDLIICQSHATAEEILQDPELKKYKVKINPLGYWTGGTDVDTGATNRKLGSDMGDGVTGGGLHGKDLSKADVSVNIYAHLKAQDFGNPVEMHCAIGDRMVNGIPFKEIVECARAYIKCIGGFEKFAEWGLF